MVIERIRQIIDYKQLSERQFCKEIGVANGFMSKVKDVGSAKLKKILDTYPDINPIWLLLGKGAMLAENLSNDTNFPEILADKNEIISTQRELIESLRLRIKELETRQQPKKSLTLSAQYADTQKQPE